MSKGLFSQNRGSKVVRCPACGARQALDFHVIGKGGIRQVMCGGCGTSFAASRPDGRGDYDPASRMAPGDFAMKMAWIRTVVLVLVVGAVALAIGIRMGRRDEIEDSKAGPFPRNHPTKAPGAGAAAASPGEAAVEGDQKLAEDDKVMRKTLGNFLGARQWTDMLDEVRHPDLSGPRMANFYADPANKLVPVTDLVVSTKVTRMGNLVVFSLSGKNLPNKRLVMEQQGDQYKVDWESFVLWQELPWKRLSSAQSDVEIRCLAKPVPNNHPSHGSDRGWLALELLQPGTGEISYGYLRKGEAESGSPRSQLESGTNGAVTLAVKPMPDSKDGGLEITRVLAMGWVYPRPHEQAAPGGK